MSRIIFLFYRSIAALLLMLCAVISRAEPLTVAVASNFLYPLKQLQPLFEQQSGHQLRLVSGSSGKLYAQLSHGAPFDCFLSADSEKPHLLEKQGFIEAGSRLTYAEGRLVLWSLTQTVQKGELLEKSITLAVANPKLAPYGMAASQVLDNMQLDRSQLKPIVRAENINQVYQYVNSGSVDAGFIAYSQWLRSAGSHGDGWLVPEQLHTPIEQQMVIMKSSQRKKAAKAFQRFMQSEEVKQLLVKMGYEISSGDHS